jgi:glucose/arabinose dehydrogenase
LKLPRLLLPLAAVLLLLALLPGDLSPFQLFKTIADALVRDGSFESIDLAFYNRLRPAFGLAGLAFLFSGWLAWWGARSGRLGAARGAWIILGVSALAGVVVIGNLAAARRSSFIYHALASSPTPTVQTAPTGTPIPTPVRTPLPTPDQPGQWQLVYEGFEEPVGIVHAGDGSGRLFIVIKRGMIRILQDGQLLDAPFLDIRDRVLQEIESPEQGFLGLAFHPDYAENGYFYVHYTDLRQNTVIARFQVSPADPNRADPASEYKLLGVVKLAEDHNGGQLAFGPDGYLYIGLGDGGIQKDPYGMGQSLDALSGKILRLDVDGGTPYAIPPDNPFVDAYGLDEIWALGLRNPWRFSFDALTGDMYIGDVGYHFADEINVIPPGAPGLNFGWSLYEGFETFGDFDGSLPPGVTLTDPIWANPIGGGVCALIGGYVYRGAALPELEGTYIFGDFCLGLVWGLAHTPEGAWESRLLWDTPFAISSFGVDEAGELYLANFGGGIYKLVP